MGGNKFWRNTRQWVLRATILVLAMALIPGLAWSVDLVVDGDTPFTIGPTESYTYDNEYIGQTTTGTLDQTGGTNTVNTYLRLGYNSGSSGTYNLSGGELFSRYEYIGYYGTGSFTQSGGTNTGTYSSPYYPYLYLGYYHGTSGTYNLSGGSLTGSQYIGYYGTGSFTQSGGTNAAYYLRVGYYNNGSYYQSSGTYDLSGGSLSVAYYEYIGYYGPGTFTQTGGTHAVGSNLYLGYYNGSSYNGSGTYNLSGTGSLSASTEYIGYYSTGTFSQDGGTHTASTLTLGYYGYYDSRGTYNLSSGSLSVGSENIGYQGTGAFTQSGGTHTVTNTLTLAAQSGSSGTYTLTDGTLSAGAIQVKAGGSFHEQGGSLSGNLTNQGTFTHDGGVFADRLINYGTANLNADFIAGDGLAQYSATSLSIGAGREITLNGSGLEVDQGANLTLEGGSLLATEAIIGNTGTGTFTQNSGTHTVTGASSLVLGNTAGSFGSYDLSSGSLQVVQEIVGSSGVGEFHQTGGVHTVTDTLTLAQDSGSQGTYNLGGGSLYAGAIEVNPTGIFNQTGGSVDGELHNQGTFTYDSGVFAGRLVNKGTATFNADFTAGNGLLYDSSETLNIPAGFSLTLNGQGLDNRSQINMAGGTLAGDGPLTNRGFLEGFGTISGSGGFTNNLYFSPSGKITLSNTGANINNANMEMVDNSSLELVRDITFTNAGSLQLNLGKIEGDGTLVNTGTLTGKGSIFSNFQNDGYLVVPDGNMFIEPDFTNSELIRLESYTANLSGGSITNTGTIEGHGKIQNPIVNQGTIEPDGSTLSLSGALANTEDGQLIIGPDNALHLRGGLDGNNRGEILIENGDLDINGPLTNDGNIRVDGGNLIINGAFTNNKTFALGSSVEATEIINTSTGSMTLGGASVAAVSASIVNAGVIAVAAAVVFNRAVVNQGQMVIEEGVNPVFEDSYEEQGVYESGEGTNYYQDLVVGESGCLVGPSGAAWEVSGDFTNQSAMNEDWNTGECELAFTTGGEHEFYITGEDCGPSMAGFDNNFAWGTINFQGQIVHLLDGDDDPGGALYVGEILGLEFGSPLIANIYGYDGLNIYYDPTLAGNDYLEGLTYSLNSIPGEESGLLTPTPLPASVLLLGSGLLGLGLLGWRRKKS